MKRAQTDGEYTAVRSSRALFRTVYIFTASLSISHRTFDKRRCSGSVLARLAAADKAGRLNSVADADDFRRDKIHNLAGVFLSVIRLWAGNGGRQRPWACDGLFCKQPYCHMRCLRISTEGRDPIPLSACESLPSRQAVQILHHVRP